MAELKPLAEIPKTEDNPIEKKDIEKLIINASAKSLSEIDLSDSLLKMMNGKLYFELQFDSGKLVVSEQKCDQMIPMFKKMTSEQKETFLMQAAIFGAFPFGVCPEIYPVPMDNEGAPTIVPVIHYKK